MIGFLGGTGPEGRGLALRFALAGHEVIVGSRDASRAEDAVNRMRERAQVTGAKAGSNAQAAQESDIVFVTVPCEAQAGLLEPLAAELADKVVVSTVAPLSFEGGVIEAMTVPEGSAATQAQRLLPQSRLVAAFQNVSATDLWAPRRVIDGDVVVCSDDPAAKETVMGLAQQVPNLRAVDGGALANARYVEGLTALLLNINRIYKSRTLVRIMGLDAS